MMLTPREQVNLELQLIDIRFKEHKEIAPLLILIKDGERNMVPVFFDNPIQKEIADRWMKDLVKNYKPDVVVYMAEAWVVSIKHLSDRLPIPSKSPDRVEMVMVQIEFSTGEKFGCDAKILRDGNNIRLDKFIIADSSTSMGRFVDFFPQTQKPN